MEDKIENGTRTIVIRDANDEPFSVSWSVTPGQTSWMVKGTRIYMGGINIYFGPRGKPQSDFAM